MVSSLNYLYLNRRWRVLEGLKKNPPLDK